MPLRGRGFRCYLLLVLFMLGTRQLWSQAATTYHYDNNRTGWNSNETVLMPSNVASSYFGVLATVPLDDQVDSQPLYMPGVNITAGAFQGTHDVLYVATEGNTVYAIDAESATVLLNPNFGKAIFQPLACVNSLDVGINSTPVIDPASSTMYVMTYTQQSSGPAYYLHALDLGSLTDKVPPQLVSASQTLSNGSTFTFNATYQRQRPGLLLANGNVYAGFGSFCDYAPNLSRGWLLGWQAGTLTPLSANHLFNLQPSSPFNFFLSSIWMSGFGPAVDDSGNILVTTGNSDPKGTTYDGVTNLQESVIKVSPDLSTILDIFTPFNWSVLDENDLDFGSGGVMVLPDQLGAYPHLAVAAGKQGSLFLMNEDGLGGYSTSSNNVLGSYYTGPCWCGPSYFVDPIDSLPRVVTSGGAGLRVWKLQPTMPPSLAPAASGGITTGQDPGFFTTVSSNGTSNPIIWAVSRPTSSDLNVYLYAFNPDSGPTMTPLYRGLAGPWPNFNGNSNLVPIVASGRVFVASHNQLRVFGLTGTLTTTQVTSGGSPAPYGQAVTFTATVQPASTTTLTPTGNVTFKDGTTVIGTAALSGATAAFTTSALTFGNHSITAVYGGDSNFVVSNSPVLTQSVSAVSTTTSVSPSATTTQYFQQLSLTATVVSATSVTPVGTVVFFDGTHNLGGVKLSAGTATLSLSNLAVGTHSITAVYSGPANFLTSTSAAVSITVGPASTTATAGTNPSATQYFQTVVLSATVTSATGPTPNGRVTFFDGTHNLGGVLLSGGAASLSVSNLTVGTHSITVSYSGTVNFAASTSSAVTVTVSKAPTTTTVVSSLNPSTSGQAVTFTATVAGANGGPGSGGVAFMDGSTTLGRVLVSATTNQAVLTISTLTVGTHNITVNFLGSGSLLPSSSSTLAQVVNSGQ